MPKSYVIPQIEYCLKRIRSFLQLESDKTDNGLGKSVALACIMDELKELSQLEIAELVFQMLSAQANCEQIQEVTNEEISKKQAVIARALKELRDIEEDYENET